MFYKILEKKSTKGCLKFFSNKIAQRFPRSFSYEDANQELIMKLLEAYNRGVFTDKTDTAITAIVFSIVRYRTKDILCKDRSRAKRLNVHEGYEVLDEYACSREYDKVVYKHTRENGSVLKIRRSELTDLYRKVSGSFADSELMSRKNAGIILKMIAEGYTHSDIADEIGVTAMYVRKLKNDYVVPALRREL